MAGQVSNRRELHKQHTRAALESAALDLFGSQGYEHTTVEEIAATAGVSIRTFFRYFTSKQHVLFGDAAHRRISRLADALAARPAGEDPVVSVRRVLADADLTDPEELAQIRRRMGLLAEQPSLMTNYLMINHELRREICSFVAARSGLPPVHPYPLLVSAAVSSAWDVALCAWAAGVGDDLASLRRDALDQLLAGVRRPSRSSYPG